MKYCIDFQKGFRYINNVDEITIIYRRQDTSLKDFLLEHLDKRINVYIADDIDFLENKCIEIFDAIMTEYPQIDMCFKLGSYKRVATQKVLETIRNSKVKYKYFFMDFVFCWDTLYGYIELNPSSIYIVEELGFEIKQVTELLHSLGIEVRCYPNIAQSNWETTPCLKRFFIRPEDIPLYERYVDVCEFIGNLEQISTIYKVYAIDKKWFGKLNELILNFDSDIDSRCLLPIFAERRMSCGKRCLKGRGCRICEATELLSASLAENNFILTIDKKDNSDQS